jgi:hypothetical protein
MRKLGFILPLVFLASLARPTSLSGPASAAVTSGSPGQVKAHNLVPVGGGDEGECVGHGTIGYGHGTLTGRAWINDCNGPARCIEHATLQIFDRRDPHLGWQTVESGVTKHGCSYADRSVARHRCRSSTDEWAYRTQAILLVLDAGRADNYYSSTLTLRKYC